MTNENSKVSAATIAELIDDATVLSEDHGEEVAVAVREAKERPLDEARARQLYTRILEILRGHDTAGLTALDREQIAETVRAEVEEIVASVKRPAAAGGVRFVQHNGLDPRDVLPVQTFNNKAIPMVEG